MRHSPKRSLGKTSAGQLKKRCVILPHYASSHAKYLRSSREDILYENLARQDYYSAGQTVTGLWHGQAAERLGLVGEVTSRHFFALADNHHPLTGEQLTPRQKHNRTPGYDFTFSAPKSVSLLYGLTGDQRIKTAMEQAVVGTMREIEGEMRDQGAAKGGLCGPRHRQPGVGFLHP